MDYVPPTHQAGSLDDRVSRLELRQAVTDERFAAMQGTLLQVLGEVKALSSRLGDQHETYVPRREIDDRLRAGSKRFGELEDAIDKVDKEARSRTDRLNNHFAWAIMLLIATMAGVIAALLRTTGQ